MAEVRELRPKTASPKAILEEYTKNREQIADLIVIARMKDGQMGFMGSDMTPFEFVCLLEWIKLQAFMMSRALPPGTKSLG